MTTVGGGSSGHNGYVTDYPALISQAEEDGRLLGVLTYIVDREQCEILTLHTAAYDERNRG
jgi:hypothetical protein